MTDKLWMREALASDLGENAMVLAEVCGRAKAGQLLVDCGVRGGVSSRVMLGASDEDCMVLGVDVFPESQLPRDLATHERYSYLQSDSVEAGCSRGLPACCGVVMLDTLHSADHVWLECLAWWRHVAVGGYLVVHDTAWPDGKHEVIAGWEHALGANGLRQFFGVLGDVDADAFHMRHYTGSYGMTFVEKRKHGFGGYRGVLRTAPW